MSRNELEKGVKVEMVVVHSKSKGSNIGIADPLQPGI
jgi:hypothetical protein